MGIRCCPSVMASSLGASDDIAPAFEGQGQRIGQRGLGGDALQVNAQMNNGLGDLRAYSADDAVRTHQPYRSNGLQQMLRHPVSYTHLRAHETPEHLVCRLLL